jgi:endonuclease/exonuclease/phosphatase family metal-dependent hydrolase
VKLKLMSYNIRFGGRGREQDIARVIRAAAPDLVVFQEAIDPTVIERLSGETGLGVWAARAAHSIAFISRVEIAHSQWHYPRGAKHSFLEIAPASTSSRIFGLHLSAMFSRWTERRRVREIQSLLKGIEHHQNGFHVLVGDFNTLAPGELLQVQRMPRWIRVLIWLSGRDIQRETIQLMLDRSYIDVYRLLHADVKGYTFPTWDPHLRLDYAFLPACFTDRVKECKVIDDLPESVRASDHFPLVTEIELT